MKRVALVVVLGLCAFLLATCGGESGLSGSQCELIDCSFDALTCRLFPDPNHGLTLHYKRELETGAEYTAIITIQLDGIDPVEGTLFEGTEFVDRVMISRPGEGNWPDIEDGKCEIKEGGDEVGQHLKGKASFRFANGRFATAILDCTLEAPLE